MAKFLPLVILSLFVAGIIESRTLYKDEEGRITQKRIINRIVADLDDLIDFESKDYHQSFDVSAKQLDERLKELLLDENQIPPSGARAGK